MEQIRFLVFADFHYKKRMYPSRLDQLDAILRRGHENRAELVLQMGDFSNDLKGSPELEEAFLRNKYGLPVYGVYGNHELEAEEDTMPFITPRLTNRLGEVHFGTPDGSVGDGMTGHYYFDKGRFRFIALDSFYSLRPDGVWEHNESLSPRPGNTFRESLGPDQLRWLRETVMDAAEKGLTVSVFSHSSFTGLREYSPDAAAVRAIFREANALRPRTVVLAMNGHYHTNHFEILEDVAFFDVNVALFGHWVPQKRIHYPDGSCYPFTDYDGDGRVLSVGEYPWNSTYGGLHGWFFREPLSAMVTLTSEGGITVEGAETEWLYGIAPEDPNNGTEPRISDYRKD